MTSEAQDRRALVAESYRYARAFYDGCEATGSAAFERNRQAIIDVIALAYRDGVQHDEQRIAALVEGVRALHNGHGGAYGGVFCYSACHALAAHEEAESA